MTEPEHITRLRTELAHERATASTAFLAVGTSTIDNASEAARAYERAYDRCADAEQRLTTALADLNPEPEPQTQTALAVDEPILNPECRDGKHTNCRLDAWDNVKDAETDCQCPCHGGDR
ncbi:hypothetical protein GRS96_12435 [Rathayibacter sp. VKM Ac-2803]|uniref:hypothetical protein n=1 Tax=Rathayibacter sp. VKM Ac-2803 TaxID=2609256 RepID=UPI001356C06E|nr:hypothetical protein [Rathayibacter sp. VKM Ac-2803]MWV50077.1 hypothetical protein [Rathayibacter sp. VKM Ac-2803]